MAVKKDPYRFFKIEARELLDKLNEGFVEVEKNPSDDLLNQLFRSAHTLKGAARLVQLENIGKIAHYLEDMMGAAKSGERSLTSGDIDRFFKGLDAIAVILDLVDKKEDPHIDVSATLSLLKGEAAEGPPPSSSPESPPVTATADTPTVVQQEATPPKPPSTEAVTVFEETPVEEKQTTKPSSAEDETIRIHLKTLNTILNLGGELVINKIKLQAKVDQLNALKKMVNLNAAYLDSWEHLQEVSEFKEIASTTPRIKETFSFLEQSVALQKQIRDELNIFFDEYEDDVKLTHLISLRLQAETFKARMLPANTILLNYKRLVRDVAKELEKEIELHVIGGEIKVDKQVLDEMQGPLMHLVRNSIDHGIEEPAERERQGKGRAGTLTLKIEQIGSALTITCEDNGRGIDVEKVAEVALAKKIITEQQLAEMSEREMLYLIMEPGFSTSEIVTSLSGRGVGLDVLSTTVNKLRGSITIQSELGQYSRFVIQLPQSLANLPTLLFRCGHEKLLIPLSFVRQTVRIQPKDIDTEGNREVIQLDGKATPLVQMNQILQLPHEELAGNRIPVVVIHSREDEIAFAVNKLLGVQEVVVKDLGSHIQKVNNVGGSTILGDGHPIIILDPAELVLHAKGGSYGALKLTEQSIEEESKNSRLLVVDDSMTTRMMEKTILESAGYHVDLAVSAEDALEKTQSFRYHLLIVDVEMPGMNGFELTKTLKDTAEYAEVPIIIVSSLATPEMKRQGIAAGAQAYIVKGEFDQKILLETIENFV
ncbi:MAG: hybrid sensor histidine kinase/response regulator [SAR324 cluster bacterium]|nr:hybrid sensor histidine kinase/response regulator [SAR324 cluster bacterium]